MHIPILPSWYELRSLLHPRQGRRSNAETELAQAQTEVELATANWVEVFGTRPGVIPTIPPAPALAGSSAQEMVERSPRLRTQVAVSQVRQQEVIVAERATRPTLSAILETDFDQGFIDDGAQARLGVTVPIYQGGSARANVKTARANLQQSQADEEELRRELQRNLSRALEETNSIQRRLETARRAVEINEQALDAARDQFNIGRSTLVQILDALRELNLAQVRVIQLEAQARRAEYAVLAVTGDILDALGVAQPTDPTL
ncbi:TolC family protein (plasmid) [Ruegeria conchae]|uniref:TolC family protein n=1 Tax=Ruegeria conchae TaxID=981384 RepID=UPI0021A717D8|nr:TolC family protein [Ruegeria conchae]UWR05473.1 TolC family protein [Ruegeria conchae]